MAVQTEWHGKLRYIIASSDYTLQVLLDYCFLSVFYATFLQMTTGDGSRGRVDNNKWSRRVLWWWITRSDFVRETRVVLNRNSLGNIDTFRYVTRSMMCSRSRYPSYTVDNMVIGTRTNPFRRETERLLCSSLLLPRRWLRILSERGFNLETYDLARIEGKG